MHAEIQKWNDPNDDVDVAYQNLRDTLYDASILADRYERALNGVNVTTGTARENIQRRAGWASLATHIIRNLYTDFH